MVPGWELAGKFKPYFRGIHKNDQTTIEEKTFKQEKSIDSDSHAALSNFGNGG